jgi:uncharacterized membrane protein
MSEVKRIRSLDMWRGLAILAMVVYHFLFFMEMQGLLIFDFSTTSMEVFGRLVQFSFLGLVGVAISLVYKRKSWDEFRYFQFIRVMIIGIWAMVFTLVSYLLFKEDFIRFGILHLISTSIFVITLFARRKLALLFLCMALILIWLGGYTGRVLDHNYLSIVGLYDGSFSSLDYFPIVPWLVIPVIGYLIGDWLAAVLQKLDMYLPKLEWLQFIGRNSLVIYVVHFPVVFALVYLIYIL